MTGGLRKGAEMQILVTGGLGFIGSNFIRHILGKYSDYKITNLDKMTYCGNPENLKGIEKNKNYNFVKGDVCDVNVVDKLVEGKDIVLNFAAETHVDRSIDDPKNFIRTDVDGTHTLLEATKKHDVKR